ncbi:MAG: DNA methyltransferase [Candidatus Methylomirabilales bacterium]
MVKAGTSERGCCPRCGAPWERIVEEPDFSEAPKRKTSRLEGQLKSHGEGFLTSAGQAWQEWRNENPSRTVGWRPTCAHEETPVPCTVVDPFAGAGTVGLVADRLGRDAILIDLNTSYIDMAAERIRKDAPLLADVRKDVTP